MNNGRALLDSFDIDRDRMTAITADALVGADDGELFVERRFLETIAFEDGRLKSADHLAETGFGLRGVAGEATAFASSADLSEKGLRRAAEIVRTVAGSRTGRAAEPPPGSNRLPSYPPGDPALLPPFADKVALLQEIDAVIRATDSSVREVTIDLTSLAQDVTIVRPDADPISDSRPLIKLGVTVVAERGSRRERGSYTFGGRGPFGDIVTSESWLMAAREAVRLALVALEAGPAPAGEMDVVLGPGWPGVLIHEAVGHGLEGDINRKRIGAFAGLMGQRVAAPGVTVIDDATVPCKRGSLAFDDEGTPAGTTTLIEDGILVAHLHDRQNARLMGARPTGNGRRQSFAYAPMPRMTNTFMRGGAADPAEIIASVERGLYAVSFGGGQVDITSGKFVFECTEAYLIENGRVGRPVKGAMLIGNGPDALKRIRMIGNDLALDPGLGQCGKYGQLVPVGVGQPTLRIDDLTVGGTE